MRKTKKQLDTTTNRTVYTRTRKHYLENKREIYCSLCPYHRIENMGRKKCYGGFDDDIRYPSWKLSTKNRKQWMKKNIRKTTEAVLYSKYYKIYTEIII